MHDVDVCQGGEAVFCVRAIDTPKIEWYRDDKQIETRGRFTVKIPEDGGNKEEEHCFITFTLWFVCNVYR